MQFLINNNCYFKRYVQLRIRTWKIQEIATLNLGVVPLVGEHPDNMNIYSPTDKAPQFCRTATFDPQFVSSQLKRMDSYSHDVTEIVADCVSDAPQNAELVNASDCEGM